jgi:DNA-binding NtrC family response regulator
MIGSKILLVDDEVVFTNNMSKLLTSRGYRVKAVNSGDSAIGALEEERFDVVVLDLKMPGMDGITTLKEIKKLGLFTETLILTGHGSIDSALDAKIEGAWEKKDDAEQKDIQKKIHKAVESPRSVFEVFPKDKRKK